MKTLLIAATILTTLTACSDGPVVDCFLNGNYSKEKCDASMDLVTATMAPSNKRILKTKLAGYSMGRLGEIMKAENIEGGEVDKGLELLFRELNGLNLSELQDLVR